MTDAPKLLTEAEWRLHYADFFFPSETLERIIAAHKQRGLIAPEVDPVLAAARDFVAELARHWDVEGHAIGAPKEYRDGIYDDDEDIQIALAALRRALELAKPELTREMVREAVIGAKPNLLQAGDFRRECHMAEAEAFIDRLHAALTEGQSK